MQRREGREVSRRLQKPQQREGGSSAVPAVNSRLANEQIDGAEKKMSLVSWTTCALLSVWVWEEGGLGKAKYSFSQG